jgi:hypothetical protein
MGLFMADVLDDALSELEKRKGSVSPAELYKQLKESEDADYVTFQQSPIPKGALTFPLPEDIEAEVIFRGPNICHPARLPAETRHLGYLTESEEIGFLDYYKGLVKAEYDQKPIKGGEMQLVQEEGRQHCDFPVLLQTDYKDYFYVHHKEEWKWLVVPNKKEAEIYQIPQYTPKGYVLVCLSTCDWGYCPEGNLLGADIAQGKAEIMINNIPVTALSEISTACYWAENANGHVFRADDESRFNVSTRVVEEGSFLRFSSIAVW